MKTQRTARAGPVGGRARKHRRRPVPRWLKSSKEVEALARSRCLMLLSVLSGEVPVTDAIAQAKISRGTYYQLETRALQAMLAAMNPLAASSSTGAADLSAAMSRIAQLESLVKRLEQDRRRTQRLLLLTRKSIRTPLKALRRGRRSRSLTVRTESSPTTSPGASSP
jgi:hypothetical protein